MAGEPAIVKVMTALVAQVSASTGITVFTDRSVEEPIMPEERPCYCLRIVEGEIDTLLGGGQVLHDLAIDADLYESTLTLETVSVELATMLSRLNAALEVDRTLGGLVGEGPITIRTFTTSSDSVPDLGCMNVGLFTRVSTPSGDFNTVMGATGVIP